MQIMMKSMKTIKWKTEDRKIILKIHKENSQNARKTVLNTGKGLIYIINKSNSLSGLSVKIPKD